MLNKVWNFLNGKKTYILVLTGLLYTASRVWVGEIGLEDAIYIVLGMMGIGTVGHKVDRLDSKIK